MRDDYGIVLDFLSQGHSDQRRAVPTAQLIGENNFNLLEVAIREGVHVKLFERIYIGSGDRDKVQSIKSKITTHDLTATAQSELESAVSALVDKNESKFVEFFNKSEPVTTRQHQIELLPGIGKKHMWQILEERKKKPFESFADIRKRISLMPDPKKAVVNRIVSELGGEEKWHIFTQPPKKDEEEYF